MVCLFSLFVFIIECHEVAVVHYISQDQWRKYSKRQSEDATVGGTFHVF